MRLEVRPLTRDRFPDLVELFSRPGASIPRSCWCMYYRKTGQGGGVGQAEANRAAMRSLVERGVVPGLIAYQGGRPVGWISLGPREDYPRLRRSPVMKPVDGRPVWSIVCLFVDRAARGRGVAEALLRAAVRHARDGGATVLEAYPVDRPGPVHPDRLWFGTRSMYERAGFTEVARRKADRPVMRRRLRPSRTATTA
ncbi:MAG TPA: GNAT family N-acetyltransferase [Actinomycetota bacterium]|nr:GNAT family N-acetyltransferase [Actinomycetota bacterium]